MARTTQCILMRIRDVMTTRFILFQKIDESQGSDSQELDLIPTKPKSQFHSPSTTMCQSLEGIQLLHIHFRDLRL